jgi:hypothetical protein
MQPVASSAPQLGFMLQKPYPLSESPLTLLKIMHPALKTTLAVVAGIITGSLVNGGIIAIQQYVIPLPPGADVSSAEGMKATMHLFEARHFVMPFLAHAFGTLAGALTAAFLAGPKAKFAAGLIGGFFLFGGIAASFMIPAPSWFIAADLSLAYLPVAYCAFWIYSRTQTSR